MQLCYWFQIKASEERQRSEPKERKTYGCQVCDHPYASCALVKWHKQDINSPKYYCNRCSFKTAHSKDLEKQYGKNGTSLAPNCMYLNTPVAAAVKIGRAPKDRRRQRKSLDRQRSLAHTGRLKRSTTPIMDETLDQAVTEKTARLDMWWKREATMSPITKTWIQRTSDMGVQVMAAEMAISFEIGLSR